MALNFSFCRDYRSRKSPTFSLSLSFFLPFFLANFLERNRGTSDLRADSRNPARKSFASPFFMVLLEYSAEVAGFALLSSLAFSRPRLTISFGAPDCAENCLKGTKITFWISWIRVCSRTASQIRPTTYSRSDFEICFSRREVFVRQEIVRAGLELKHFPQYND